MHIRSHKTPSFVERKHTCIGFQRQFSGQMSDVNNASDAAFATAVAAAAYAITSLEEEDPLNQKRPPAKIKSKREDSMNKPTDNILSRWLTGYDEKQSGTFLLYVLLQLLA